MYKRLASLALLTTLTACTDRADAPLTPDASRSSASAADPHPMNARPPVGILSHSGGAIISNGTVQLGVNPEGHLNAPYSPDPLSIGYMGLRYVPTGGASTEPGCQCEGWGVGDVYNPSSKGGANISSGGVSGITVESFTHDATTATSVVSVAGTFRVTHEYKPSPATPNLYEVLVTIENISSATVKPRYRRVMDWDIYPTPFSEFVTLKRGTATDIYRTDNNGFNSWDPFSFGSFGLQDVDFEDAGPSDHGALFDFEFADLAPGAKKSFKTYYGAAGTEADALGALGAVSAEAFSLGQCNPAYGPGCDIAAGTPNTFIFGFGGIGGKPIVGPTMVGIDIKPGSNPNSLKLNDRGDARIAVAVLSTGSFSAASVDPAKTTLGDGAGTDASVAKRTNGTLMSSMEDADGDGDLDRVLHFDRQALLANGDLTSGTTELVLLGELGDGTKIKGVDAVRVIP